MPKIGIESLGFASAKNFIAIEDLAIRRGVDPEKYIQGLGQKEMAIITPCEDTVTMAAHAGLRALENADINPESIDLLIVGTETGIDHSKPAASYVHELLKLSPQCRVIETKHACYGATAGLQFAIDRALAGRSNGKKSLIIASDIARYGIGTAGEPTQGAGAAAIIVSDNPRLINIETEAEGLYSKQVMDFWRPLYNKEAVVDGHFSVQCYLDAIEGSYTNWQQSLTKSGNPLIPSQDIAACLYHVPFGKMAKKAHEKYLSLTGINDRDLINKDYNLRVTPYLELCSRVGNVYTGSLYFSLYNLMVDAGELLSGKPISMFSYGSGCMAEYFQATIAKNALKLPDYRPILDERTRVDASEYERLFIANTRADENNNRLDPKDWGSLDNPFIFQGVENHKRQYIRNN